MNEEQATICRELAEAMGYVIDAVPYGKGFRYRLEAPECVPEFMRFTERCDTEEEAWNDWRSPRYFTDWNATGALMEWWLSNDERGISEQKRIGDGTYLTEVRFVRYETDDTYYYKVAYGCQTAQEAITRAIHAAVVARRKDGETR